MFAASLLVFAVTAALCGWRLHRTRWPLEAGVWLVLTVAVFGWSLTVRPLGSATGLVAFLVLDLAVVAISVTGCLRLLSSSAPDPEPGADGGSGGQEPPPRHPGPGCPGRGATPRRRRCGQPTVRSVGRPLQIPRSFSDKLAVRVPRACAHVQDT